MVPEMIGLGVLAELDTVQLPNIIHLDDKFKNPAFDPGNKYSIPYLWGTTGVGWNSAKVTDPIKSCADVLEPEKVRRWEEGGAKREVSLSLICLTVPIANFGGRVRTITSTRGGMSEFTTPLMPSFIRFP